jgi:hypothetical protein
MPLARYFVFTGSLLLALLFLLSWYLPPPTVEAARAADHPTIRLQSAHKWPSAVVFDTTQPAIVPPPVTVADQAPPAQVPSARSPLEALAMVQPKEPSPVIAAVPAAAPKRVVRRARVARTPPRAPQVAGGYDMFGFRNPFPGGW